MIAKGGIAVSLKEHICPKCGYKLSILEQIKYKRLPLLYKFIDILGR